MNTKNPTKANLTLDQRPTIQEWKEILHKTLPLLHKICQKAVSVANPAMLNMAIWQQLPKRVTALCRYAAVASHSSAINPILEKLRFIALQKIACRLTAPNRWHLPWEAWQIGQELQQLWPLWKNGLVWEFRWNFERSLSPKQISNNMSLIRDMQEGQSRVFMLL